MVAEVLQFVRNGKTVLKDFMNGLAIMVILMIYQLIEPITTRVIVQIIVDGERTKTSAETEEAMLF